MFVVFFFQAEDGIRDLVRSRGLGDVYKRQAYVQLYPGRGTPEANMDAAIAAVRRECAGGPTWPLSLIHI